MRGEQQPKLVRLRAFREQALERLSDAFVKDEVSLEEFEQRVDAAYLARDEDALQALLNDLSNTTALALAPETTSELIVSAPHAGLARLDVQISREQPKRTLAVLGNAERRGHFRVDDGARALAVFGNIELDLRQVAFPPGVTRLYAKAVFGNVEIIVPPTLAVECEGTGVLGNFSTVQRVPQEGGDVPVLRVIGIAVLGNIEVRTRPLSAARGALGSGTIGSGKPRELNGPKSR